MRIILPLLMVFLLAACQPYYIRTEQVNQLSRGSNSEQVKSVLEKEPDKVTQVEIGGAEYTVHLYQMLTDVIEQMSMVCDQYGCYPIMYTEPVTEPYAIVYRDQEAVFWGFVEELNKHHDPALNEVGRATISLLKE
jgi:hypothetical protein